MRVVDKALEIGASADWITPLFALVRTKILHTHVMFVIDKYDLLYAQMALKKKGIRIQDGQIIDDVCVFTVKIEHARWAADLLPRNGVPVLNAEQVHRQAQRDRKNKTSSRMRSRKARSIWSAMWG